MEYSEGLAYMSNKNGTCTLCGMGTCQDLDIVVPEIHNGQAVVAIGKDAFSRTKIRSIKIPNSVKIIRKLAFYECANLEHISISRFSNLEVVEESAFYGCETLRTISLPTTLTDIGKRAFMHCYTLSTIDIPRNIKSIGDDAFNLCGDIHVYLPLHIKHIGKRAFSQNFAVLHYYNR